MTGGEDRGGGAGPAWRALVPKDLAIQFSETVTFGDGQPADLRAVFWPALEFLGTLSIRGRPVRPKVVLSGLPTFNAEAVATGGGVVRLNLGLVAAFTALPGVATTLEEAFAKEQMSLDEIAAIPLSTRHVEELDALFASWRTSRRSGWKSSRFPASARSHRDPTLGFMLQRLVVGHELGHLASLLDDPGPAETMRRAWSDRFAAWVAGCAGRPGLDRWATFLAANPAARASWEEEVRADQIGYITVGRSTRSPREVAALNAGSGVLFALEELFELFLEREGVPASPDIHPPAAVRRDAFTRIRAAWCGLDEPKFVSTEWGAGWLATHVIQRIVHAYRAAGDLTTRRRPPTPPRAAAASRRAPRRGARGRSGPGPGA